VANWPGTPGGASSPDWGGDIRLYVWIAIAAGSTMKWGPAPTDRLDAGNVWGTGVVTPAPPAGRLWVDVSCDVLTLDTHVGGSRPDNALSKGEAGTCSLTLYDPERIYDPTNPASPFQFGGRSRLAPGTVVWVWAETLKTPSTVDTWRMFTGSVDHWEEAWQLHPADRKANVVCSDAVKTLVRMDWGEQPAIGAGDTVTQRIQRILSYYSYAGATNLDSSSITEQATTLAQSAWELVGRATDDELGFVYIDRLGTLQFRNRATWQTNNAPVLAVGCPTGYDCVTDAQVNAGSDALRNAVYATNTGGTQQIARAQSSIDLYGLYSYKRTDLGMQNDAQAGAWAAYLLTLSAVPRAHVDKVTLKPVFTPAIWPTLLGLSLITDRVRVQWQPPNEALIEATGRALSVDHTISRHSWEVDLGLALADVYGRVMHWGAHPYDRLTSGYVYV